MSRGTTRRIAFGRRTRTLPKSSRSVTKTRPSGPPAKPPFRLRSTTATAPGGGASGAWTTATGWPASSRSSARRGAWSLARTILPPSACQRSTASAIPAARVTGRLRLAPAEQVAGAQPAGGEGGALGDLGLPGQLEGPARDEAGLPVARPEVGRRPVLGEIAARDELGPPLVGLAPQEVGRLRDLAGLVEDEEGRRIEVVERGRRSELGGPDLGGVADGEGPGRDGGPAGRGRVAGRGGRVRRRRSLEPGEVSRQPLRQLRRRPAEALPERGDALVRGEELRRGQEDRLLERSDRPLVGRVEGPQRVDLVAEELDPDRQRGGRREDVDDPAPPGELAAAGDLGGRRVAEAEQFAEERLRPEPGADGKPARLGRQVVRGDRVLEERLDARHEDPGVAAAPGGQGGDAGGRLVGDELAPLIGEGRPGLQHDDGARVAEPGRQLLGDAVADLGVAGDPGQPLAARTARQGRREERLRPVRHRPEADVAPRAPGGGGGRAAPEPFDPPTAAAGTAAASRPRRSAKVPVAARSGGSADRSGWRRPAPLPLPDEALLAAASRRSRPRLPRIVGPAVTRPPRGGGPSASRSSSAARRRRRAGRRPRRARRAGSRRPAAARTC